MSSVLNYFNGALSSSGSLVSPNVKSLSVQSAGAAPCAGLASIALGQANSAPIATTLVTANSLIFVSVNDAAPTAVAISVHSIVPGVSFVIGAAAPVAANTAVAWFLVNPA